MDFLMPPTFAFLELPSGMELLVIMIIVLLLFGGKRLPELARGVGKAMRELKNASTSMEQEFKRALDETPPPAAPPPAAIEEHQMPESPHSILPPPEAETQKPEDPPSPPEKV